ncbi:hypothetical protein P171DRAFT_281932 [Karstenula rhodostoma CBS 690.94]|uniref:Uncharacterized protein n=1 Tax=Karstenula rhodostoma CBS 690.94 TaxID=1392251 RepID=A0A9P4PGP1_9PLEO|nr:hypothetical protein P171DRAFT_281932 [Karstenula rhodostoma CBS 690.94]
MLYTTTNTALNKPNISNAASKQPNPNQYIFRSVQPHTYHLFTTSTSPTHHPAYPTLARIDSHYQPASHINQHKRNPPTSPPSADLPKPSPKSEGRGEHRFDDCTHSSCVSVG